MVELLSAACSGGQPPALPSLLMSMGSSGRCTGGSLGETTSAHGALREEGDARTQDTGAVEAMEQPVGCKRAPYVDRGGVGYQAMTARRMTTS